MSRLLLVPLDDTVVFPNMSVTLTVDVGDEDRVLLVPRTRATSTPPSASSPRWSSTSGCPAAPGRRGAERPPPRPRRRGHDGRPTAASRRGRRAPRRRARRRAARASSSASTAPSSRRSSSCAATTAASRPSCARSPSAGALADTSGYSPDLTFEQKVELLETLDVGRAPRAGARLQRERLAELQVRKRIRDDVESGAQKQQREYFLRKQMDSIRKELGEDDGSVVEEYRTKIDAAGMPDARARAGRARARAPRADGRAERARRR